MILGVLCALAIAAPVSAAHARWELSGIEFYGSDRLNAGQFAAKHGEDIRHMFGRWGSPNKVTLAQGEALRAKLERAVQETENIGWARLDVVDAGRSEKGVISGLLMFDVIEKNAMSQRYPFRDAPEKDVPDTSDLIEKWASYENAGRSAALASGADLKRAVCPAYYCPEGTGTPEINALETSFVGLVPANKQLLLHIMREDKNGLKRARALYLLTYLKDASDVTALVSSGLTDPDTRVREAAVTIFNDIAIHRQDIILPVKDVARMLDYPTAPDRQRALALLLSVSGNPEQVSFILGQAADQVLRLLRTKHPGVRDMAYTLLTLISRETHPVDDYAAWDKWLWRARQVQIRKGTQ